MAVRETLELDLQTALRQVAELERMILDLGRPVTLDLDIRGDAAREIQTIDERMDDIIDSAQALARELGDTEGAAREVGAEFGQVATELAVAEDRAGDLARELIQADRAASGLDTEVSEAAGALGRAEREAGGVTRELRQADRAAEALDRSASGLERKLRGAFSGLAAGAALAVGLRGAFGATQLFSDLQEATSKADVVFGNFANTVIEFAEDAPAALGSTQQAAIEAAATFGNLFLGIGFSQGAAADLSTDLVQLATDLASFNNIEVSEAIDKLRAGLVGETEPLRPLGVLLSEAAVQAKALELNLGGVTGTLTEAEKVQARYAIIMDKTTTAQGDFARTSEGVANLQRTAGAASVAFGTDVGEVLVPALEGLLGLVPDVLEGLRQLVPGFANAADSAGEFFDALGEGEGVRAPFQAIVGGLGLVGDAFAGFTDIGSGLFDTLMLDFEGVGEQMDQFADRFARATKRIVGQNLARELDKGTNSSLAFVNSLSAFGRQEENLRVFADSYQTFAIQANLSSEALRESTRFMIENAEQAGLSADEIQFLREQLALLNDALDGVDVGAQRAANRLREEFVDLPPIFADPTQFTTFATDVDAAAAAAAQDLTELAAAAEAQAARTAAAFDLFADQPEKIAESFRRGVDDLRRSVQEQIDFDVNIAILRALNLDALADDFSRLGVAAADQLVEAVNDIPTAIEANRLLQGFGELGKDAFDALVAKFVGAGLTPADARKLAETLASPQVIAAATEAGKSTGAAAATGTVSSYREALIEEGEQLEMDRIARIIGERVEESFTADDQAEYAAGQTVAAWEDEAIRAARDLSPAELQAALGDLFSGVIFNIDASQFNFPDSGAFQGTIGSGAVLTPTVTTTTPPSVVIYQNFTGEIRDLDTQLAQAAQSTAAAGTLLNRVVAT